MVGKSAHLQVIPRKGTQNAANLPLQTCDKNQWTFLYDMGVGFNSLNNCANLGSFAKVSVPLQFIIPWCYIQMFSYSSSTREDNSSIIIYSCLYILICILIFQWIDAQASFYRQSLTSLEDLLPDLNSMIGMYNMKGHLLTPVTCWLVSPDSVTRKQ